MRLCFLTIFFVIFKAVAAPVQRRSTGHDDAKKSREKDVCPFTWNDPNRSNTYRLRNIGNASHMCCQCNPGERLVEACKKFNPRTTKCEPCSNGTFITEYAHQQTTCHIDRRICPPGEVLIPSTPTTNSICICVDGFKEKGENKCRPYTKCPPGSGVASFGTPNTDTVCSPCKYGYESPEYSSTQGCTLAIWIFKLEKNEHLKLSHNIPSLDDNYDSTPRGTISTDCHLLLLNSTDFNVATQIPENGTNECETIFGLKPKDFILNVILPLILCLLFWNIYALVSKKIFKLCETCKAHRGKELPGRDAVFDPAKRKNGGEATVAISFPAGAQGVDEPARASNSIETLEKQQTPLDIDKPEEAENEALLIASSSNQPISNATSKQRYNDRQPNTPKASSSQNTYSRKKSLKLKKKLNTATKEELPSTAKMNKLSSNDFTSRSCVYSCLTTEPASPLLMAAPFLDQPAQPHQPNINPTSRSTQPNIDRSQLPVSTLLLTELRENLMNNLMMRLSTEIANRDEVKEFYRRILKHLSSRQFIADLDVTHSNSSTSEWFIAVFQKLTDQGYNHFNPQIIYNHFISVNNRRLAEIVEEYRNPQIWNAQPMTTI